MEITRETVADVLVVRLKGRLDATWSRHVGETVSGLIREGSHRIHLDMTDVQYVSSAGIGILLYIYKELQSVGGEFGIPAYSQAVRQVIDLAGLSVILSGSALPTATPAQAQAAPETTKLDRITADFEIWKLSEAPPIRTRLVGSPAKLASGAFGAADCHRESFADGVLGLGLGAFGSTFEDCRHRFGELLAVAGHAAYLPSDAHTPDYLIQEGNLIPEANLIYGLVGAGKFSQFATFRSKSSDERVGLREVATTCLEISGGDAAWVVVLAEAASLVGATLSRSPAAQPGANPFSFPAVRDWFSFTVERAHAGGICLAVGLIVRKAEGTPWEPFVRPLGVGEGPGGHFHAAAFSYRPLRKGRFELKESVGRLFEHQNLEGVLHLLSDDREHNGVGESEFNRGACWIAPAALENPQP